jgi:hypothetical protein
MVMASLLFTPFMASAQIGDRASLETRFCENLDEVESKIMTTLSTRLETAKTRYLAHLDTLTSKRETALTALDGKRGEVDVKWEEQVAKLKAKAKTEAQKTAVNTYESTVESLVAERRAKVDAAVDTFVTSMNDLRKTSATAHAEMLDVHEAEMEAAFAEAAAACEAGTASATVRKELQDSLQAIRLAFRAERVEYTSRDEYQALRQTRTAATEAARQVFRVGLEEANKKLRADLSPRI